MKSLLESYKRGLKTINEDLKITINEGTDFVTIIRLVIKRKCYQEFISDMERITPPAKPVDQKVIAEENKKIAERERELQEKQDVFNNWLLSDEFEPKEKDPFEEENNKSKK